LHAPQSASDQVLDVTPNMTAPQAAVTTQDTIQDPRVEPIAPLRICLLGYRSNPFSGGQGVYLKYLSKSLVQLGHQVDVISGEPYPDLDPRVGLIKLPGLNLFEQRSHVRALRPRHFGSLADLTEYFSMLTGGFAEPYSFGRRLVAYLKRHRPHYDVLHDNQSLAYGLLRLQRLDYALLTTIHHPITWDRDIALANAPDWQSRLLIRRWHSFLGMQIRVARKLKHVVTVSERSRADISTAFGIDQARLSVVHNGIDGDDFYPIRGVTRNPSQLISTASADQPLKGTQHLIRALAQLRRTRPQLTLIIIGRPKKDGPTERLINSLGLANAVQFRHGLRTSEIRELYAQSAIAIVPSEYEGFGLPAGEAMACGVPVVSTDGGALPEVVGDAGVVVPAKDPDALADSVAMLLDNPDLRNDFARRGIQRIGEHFSWDHAARQMTRLYAQVMAA
jgi:glycosyltransferase involved in cell wall biosynthesis